MAGSNGKPDVGWQRVVIIAVVSTSFAVLMDYLGVINAIERAVNSWR
jgi:hypothetical protein